MNYFQDSELVDLRDRVQQGQFWSPRIVNATLLERCNWRCRMCDCDQTSQAMLSGVEWVDILVQFSDLGAHEIKFTGGEPTLHPDFEFILEALRQHNPHLKTKLLTNATSLTRDRAHRFLDLGLSRYIISLHSHRKSIHDRMVGAEGQWLRTIEGITHLREAGPDASVWINCVVDDENLFDLVGMVELVAGLGCNGISFSIMDDRVPDFGAGFIPLETMKRAQLEIFPVVRQVAAKSGLGLFPETCELFGESHEEMVLTSQGQLSRGWYEDNLCFWVWYHVTIKADGTVQPCCNAPLENGYGNIISQRADQLLSGKPVSAFLKEMKRGPSRFKACRKCEMKLQVNRSIGDGLSRIDGSK